MATNEPGYSTEDVNRLVEAAVAEEQKRIIGVLKTQLELVDEGKVQGGHALHVTILGLRRRLHGGDPPEGE